jgi:membrane fusion protein (multidrug efflux system)
MVISLLLTACDKPKPSAQRNLREDTIPVTLGKMQMFKADRTLSVVGTLMPKDEALVSAEVEGRVEKVAVEIGDQVSEGRELASIDTRLYEAQAQLSAANRSKAQANLAQAEQNLSRIKALQHENIASQSDMDLAIAQASSWQAEVQAQEAANAISQLNLRRSHVKAPFSGSVADRLVSAGDYVKVGTSLFGLINDAELKLMVQVPERHAGEVKLDQAVRFTVDAYPKQAFEGRVYWIGPLVNAASRTFGVGVFVANGNGKLKANSYARGELILARDVAVMVVPINAVVNFSGISRVYVFDDGVARKREVTTGRVLDSRLEILTGLKGDEQVILSGVTKLYDGVRVKEQAERDPTKDSG